MTWYRVEFEIDCLAGFKEAAEWAESLRKDEPIRFIRVAEIEDETK